VQKGDEQAARRFDRQLLGILENGSEKSGKGSSGSKSQKRAAGREGGKKSSGK
jgi:hypothetical protein